MSHNSLSTQDQPSPHRVDDIHKAETMAYASDAFRTNAADLRKADAMYDAKEAILASTNGQTNPSRLGPLKRRAHERRRKQAGEEYMALDQPYRKYSQLLFNRIYRERSQETSLDEATEFANRGHGELSKEFDQRADWLEEVAGVLHDHPVSEAFRKTSPEVDVTPKGLLIQKEAAERTQAKADFYRERVQHTQWDGPEEDDLGGGTGYGALEGLMYRIGGREDIDAITKENELHFMRRMKASQEDLNEFYRALYIEANVKPLEDKVAQTQGIFDAIQRDIHAELPELHIQTTPLVAS
jgi:hypothetical protein